MINKRFEKILKDNTREEFNNKFKIYGDENCAYIYYNTDEIECNCPYIQNCSPNENCIKCWEENIKNFKFKEEN